MGWGRGRLLVGGDLCSGYMGSRLLLQQMPTDAPCHHDDDGCHSCTAHPKGYDEGSLPMIFRFGYSTLYISPREFWSRLLIVGQLLLKLLCPFLFHCGGFIELMYCLISLVNRAFARWSCEADVLAVMPSNRAISLWLLFSKT